MYLCIYVIIFKYVYILYICICIYIYIYNLVKFMYFKNMVEEETIPAHERSWGISSN